MPSTYTPIATYTVSGSSTNLVTFSSIASTYTDIVAIISAKDTGGFDTISILFNNDTGSNYSKTTLSGNGTSATSLRNTSSTALYLAAMDATDFCANILNIQNYANSTTYKTALCRSNSTANVVRAEVGLWRSTSAINRLDFRCDSGNYVAGSTFTLYGIKAA